MKSSEKGLIINKKNTFMTLKVHFNLTNTGNGKCHLLLFLFYSTDITNNISEIKKLLLFIHNKYNERSQIFNKLKLCFCVYVYATASTMFLVFILCLHCQIRTEPHSALFEFDLLVIKRNNFIIFFLFLHAIFSIKIFMFF